MTTPLLVGRALTSSSVTVGHLKKSLYASRIEHALIDRERRSDL